MGCRPEMKAVLGIQAHDAGQHRPLESRRATHIPRQRAMAQLDQGPLHGPGRAGAVYPVILAVHGAAVPAGPPTSPSVFTCAPPGHPAAANTAASRQSIAPGSMGWTPVPW